MRGSQTHPRRKTQGVSATALIDTEGTRKRTISPYPRQTESGSAAPVRRPGALLWACSSDPIWRELESSLVEAPLCTATRKRRSERRQTMKRKVPISVWVALCGIVLGTLLSSVQAEAQGLPDCRLPGVQPPCAVPRGSGITAPGLIPSDPDQCRRCLAEDRRRFDECMEQARQYRKEHLEGDKSGSLGLHSFMVGSCSSSPDVCSEECGHVGR